MPLLNQFLPNSPQGFILRSRSRLPARKHLGYAVSGFDEGTKLACDRKPPPDSDCDQENPERRPNQQIASADAVARS
jgi:hypothetical protein